MSDEIINVEIDVTKISKNRLKTVKRKDGTEAKFLKATLMPRKDDYGNDYMVVESTTKEERAEKVKGAIIGNARAIVFNKREAAPQRRQAEPQHTPSEGWEDDSSIPF